MSLDPRELLLRAAQSMGLIDTDKAKAMPTGVDETLAELSRLGLTDVERVKNSVRAVHDKLKQGQITAEGAITQIVQDWPIGPTLKLTDTHPAIPAPIAAGEAIAKRYTLQKEIGRGGMGQVYKAYDAQLRREVAVKFLVGGDADDIGRFKNEAFIAAKLSHPNIAQVYDVGEHHGRHFIVMQFVDGDTLARKKLALREALQIMKTVAEAIAAAHRNKIVHRDIKPGNLMISYERGPEGSVQEEPPRGGEPDGRVFVMDFGLAKQMKSSVLTTQGTILGTPAYMAPEQARGETATPLSDVYSLGATLYDLLVGRPPFLGKAPLDVIKQIESSDPVPPRRLQPDLPREVETIVLRAMEKEPSQRYESAGDLAADLGRYLSGEPIQARPHGVLYRWRKRISRHRLVSALAVILLLVPAYFGIQSYRTERRHRSIQSLLDPARKDILEAMLMKYRSRGDMSKIRSLVDRAHQKITEAERIDPDNPETNLERARAFRVQDEADKADAAFGRAIALDPQNMDARVERLMLHFAQLRRHSGMTLVTSASVITHVTDDDRAQIGRLSALMRAEIPSIQRSDLVEALRDFIDGKTSTTHVDACLKADEHSPDAHVLRGYLQMARGEFAEAGKSFDAALVYRSTDPSLWNLLAHCEIQCGRLDDALDSLNASIDIWPNQWRAQVALSGVYSLKGEFQKAADACTEVLQRVPNLALAHNNRAVANIGLKNISAAEEDLRLALKLEPRYFDAFVTRAAMYLEQKKTAEAVHDLESAFAVDPAHLEAELVRLAGSLTLRSDFDSALAVAEVLARQYPASGQGFWRRGSVHYAKGEYPQALECFALALERRKDDPLLQCDHANALLSLGRFPEAQVSYSRAIQLSPTFVIAYVGRAQARANLNDVDGAESDFKQAAQLDPRNAHPYFAWGNFAYSIRDYERASFCFGRALELRSDFADAWNNLGNTHLARQDVAKAVDAYSRAIQAKPDVGRFYYNRGAAYWRQNLRPAALEDFRKCLELDPSFKELVDQIVPGH